MKILVARPVSRSLKLYRRRLASNRQQDTLNRPQQPLGLVPNMCHTCDTFQTIVILIILIIILNFVKLFQIYFLSVDKLSLEIEDFAKL